MQKMSMPDLILASGSQRRQQFLTELGLPFRVVVADIDETPLPAEHPGAMTWRLAEEKARAVALRLAPVATPALIIASDTTVALGDEIYGKPLDADDAVRMLVDLRGRPHSVISAVSILRLPDDRQTTRVNTTQVLMRDYGDAEIEAYVASGDPLDKAGAYGIQERTFACVAALDGCYASVMGLPLGDLRDLLAEFDVTVPVAVEEVCARFNTFACCASRAPEANAE
jgi:septum formation protein